MATKNEIQKKLKGDKALKAVKAVKEVKAPKVGLKEVPFWIGFDLGGTKMLATVLDEQYHVLGVARKATNGSDGLVKGKAKVV